MYIGVPSTKLKDYLKSKKYYVATDEGVAVSVACGHYLATGQTPVVFMDSNGFANALDAITSLVIPYKIPMEIVIGKRNDVEWHAVMGNNLRKIINLLKHHDKRGIIKWTIK